MFVFKFLLLILVTVKKPEQRHEQRVNLKFLCKAGFKPIEGAHIPVSDEEIGQAEDSSDSD